MAGRIEAYLKEKGIELPEASASAANYVPFTRSGSLVHVSGQVSQWSGERFGEAGKHARSAVGVAALPGGVAVEVEGVFEIAATSP